MNFLLAQLLKLKNAKYESSTNSYCITTSIYNNYVKSFINPLEKSKTIIKKIFNRPDLLS